MVLCLLTMKKKENVKKKVQFRDDVKQPTEAGMMCTINGDTFYSFTRNTWIRDSGASCHITNDDTGIYDVTDINESIKGSSRIVPATKKGKLHVMYAKSMGLNGCTLKANEVLPEGRCKPVFPNLQTLAGKQELK